MLHLRRRGTRTQTRQNTHKSRVRTILLCVTHEASSHIHIRLCKNHVMHLITNLSWCFHNVDEKWFKYAKVIVIQNIQVQSSRVILGMDSKSNYLPQFSNNGSDFHCLPTEKQTKYEEWEYALRDVYSPVTVVLNISLWGSGCKDPILKMV